ncbi:putative transcription factor c2h2 protein [Botrytis fragariae]|uniref:Putative transcription factor c2h2 protein n=1 Tax=Botrytis fragariae TaxID=1964551 RepID=A0A8H6ELW9_9HELO|nr:putative transcription factor c2h2 protein [Botrytis fragariae]KAF5877082.1 putative transcription factor c2h2 protein [Botrytis fragariae]
MSYDTLPYSTMEPPFFQENRSNPQSFRHEDLMDIESSWIQNIDPLLRQSQMSSPDFEYRQNLPQQPLQRFITEPGRALFTTVPTMTHFDSFSRPPHRAFEPVSVYPQASRTRMISPSPSQELSSNCSSARSPATETDWYHDGYYSSQGQDDYTLPNISHTTSQNFSDIWTSPQILIGQPTGYPCVNLSDVQAFADPQEIKFETDETYVDYAIQASESGSHKLVSHISHYRDEGLGASIRDAASPQAISIQASNNDNTSTISDADVDAQGDGIDVHTNGKIDMETEIDSELLPQDGDIEEEDEPSDTEYTPRPSTRNPRKRTSTTTSYSPPTPKRNRISNSSTCTSRSSSKFSSGGLSCKQCASSGFKDTPSLQRHIASAHPRAFICVFNFAGCDSTFASKNEWKRHVSSQHLNLQAWVCTLGSCGKVPLSSHSHSASTMRKGAEGNANANANANLQARGYGEIKGAEFNRKDLFTQHLRRMHAPFEVKRKGKKNVEWEVRVKVLQSSCERSRREAPERLGCPMRGCAERNEGLGVWFEGRGCWDERMEHLGKHLESVGKAGGVMRQEDDGLFVEWAVEQKIIERGGGEDGFFVRGRGAMGGRGRDLWGLG